MKAEVLHSLFIAKVLFEKAQELCLIDDKHAASAGLVILQDGLELVFIAALIEKGVDEKKPIENLGFSQLIGELSKEGIQIPKSATLKALNRQRVLVKHYGQISEPATVATYFLAAQHAANSVLDQAVGKQLPDLFLHEIIQNEEVKEYLTEAAEALSLGKYFKVLVNCRKAIYLEIESDYCVYDWRDVNPNEPAGFLLFGRDGQKAPWYTRNKNWIAENVHTPFAYIQLDHDRIRQDLLEWGAGTQDFWNLWRLTLQVMRFTKDGEWLLKGQLKYIHQASTEENARYCLERTISLLSNKESHERLSRSLAFGPEDIFQVRLKKKVRLHSKASVESESTAELLEGATYNAHEMVPGLDGSGKFVLIFHIQEDESKFLSGYVEFDACEILEPEVPTQP